MTEARAWQSLSPVASLYYFAQFWLGWLKSYLIWAIPIVVLRETLVENWALVLLAALVLVAASGLWSWISYRVVRFQVQSDRVTLRTGVFRKQWLELPFAKVQNVRLDQPWYFRPSGHCQLVLESAGSKDQELTLVAMRLPIAQALRDSVLAKRAQAQTQAQNQAEAMPGEELDHAAAQELPLQLLNRRSLADLALYGIGSHRGWLVLGLLAPFYGSLWDLGFEFLADRGLNIDLESASMAVWQLGLVLVSLLAMLMLLLTLLSIVMAVVQYYDFCLYRSTDQYLSRMGLFSRRELSLPLTRIQSLTEQQDWLDRLLGRVHLKYEQVSDGLLPKHQLVPALLPAQSQALMDDLFTAKPWAQLRLSPVSARLLWRYALWHWLPIALASVWATVHWLEVTDLVWVSLPLLLYAGLLFSRWRRWGYAMDDEYLYLQSGWLGQRRSLIPLAKIQQQSLAQTPIMRRHGLYNLVWVTASGSFELPYVPGEAAMALANLGLYQLQSQAKSWM